MPGGCSRGVGSFECNERHRGGKLFPHPLPPLRTARSGRPRKGPRHAGVHEIRDAEFFIRKAIGWALRDLAWEDLETVERYVAANQDRLSGLSKREALKNAAKIRATGAQ